MVSLLTDFLATGFYSGKSPKAPGTCGTLLAMFLAWIFYPAFGLGSLTNGIIISVLITAVAIVVCNVALKRKLYGEEHDPQKIVIDEFAGYAVAIAGLGATTETFVYGFLLFRFFDITKPPPIKRLEKLLGSVGIVIDDVVAGIFANVAFRVLMAFLN